MPNLSIISPWASDKRIGAELNRQISPLPDDEWIVVRDGDTMFLTHDWGEIIMDAIKDNPNAALMTCRTNRAWGQGFDEDPNAINHYRHAEKLAKMPSTYTKAGIVLPAFFWLFPKRTWIKNPFDEHPIIHLKNSFDTRWCRKVTGQKLIIERLYVFHYYRLHKKTRTYEHLL